MEANLSAPVPTAFSVKTLKQQFQTLAAAKSHYHCKTRSWSDLAKQLNARQGRSPEPSRTASTPLIDALGSTRQRSPVAFCTPGHKLGRHVPESMQQLIGLAPFQADFPDLPGLNLFETDGVIAAAQTLAAETFGADRTWFLVNGATVGVMATILATCGPSDKIIVPRNAHASVISGLVLAGAHPIFIQPVYDPEWDLVYSSSPATITAALKQHPDVKAVLIVSPTYHGVCGDVAAIAHQVHQHHIPLIVDEAHGAHFGFHPSLPPSALSAGADLVVQSTHKGLSALTQAAMLHLQGTRIDAARLQQILQLLQSSSPSSLLLASLDGARQQVALQGQSLLEKHLRIAKALRQQLTALAKIRVLERPQKPQPGFRDLDPLRLTVDVSGLGMDGFTADEQLMKQFGVIAELPSQRHITFILGLGTQSTDIKPLLNAFQQWNAQSKASTQPQQTFSAIVSDCEQPLLSPRQAFFAAQDNVPLPQAIGRISAETICPYPPGIPLLLPGEVITESALTHLLHIQASGGLITGCTDASLRQLRVVSSALRLP
jgi:arginine/lysine/ornithine decarboxylase